MEMGDSILGLYVVSVGTYVVHMWYIKYCL